MFKEWRDRKRIGKLSFGAASNCLFNVYLVFVCCLANRFASAGLSASSPVACVVYYLRVCLCYSVIIIRMCAYVWCNAWSKWQASLPDEHLALALTKQQIQE